MFEQKEEEKRQAQIKKEQERKRREALRAQQEAERKRQEALKAVSLISRDNARTPMQWNSQRNAGFSKGQETWLIVNPNYKEINVEDEIANKDSVYHYYKELIALRKNPAHKETLVYGKFEPLPMEWDDIVAFYRKSEEEVLLIMANYCGEEREVILPEKIKGVILENGAGAVWEDDKIWLKPYQAVVLEILVK